MIWLVQPGPLTSLKSLLFISDLGQALSDLGQVVWAMWMAPSQMVTPHILKGGCTPLGGRCNHGENKKPCCPHCSPGYLGEGERREDPGHGARSTVCWVWPRARMPGHRVAGNTAGAPGRGPGSEPLQRSLEVTAKGGGHPARLPDVEMFRSWASGGRAWLGGGRHRAQGAWQ